jgi:hypothetical protein
MGTDFHATRMGQRLFESTMPRIADELARLNRNLEALVALLDRRGEGPSPVGTGADAAERQPSAAARNSSR